MEQIFSFQKLVAYTEARKLVKEIYRISSSFPIEERHGITSQIRRAAVSIPSNIAEGSGRRTYREKIRFLEIAYGSLMEAYCQLEVALDLGLILETELKDLKPYFFSVSRLINALSQSFQKNISDEK